MAILAIPNVDASHLLQAHGGALLSGLPDGSTMEQCFARLARHGYPPRAVPSGACCGVPNLRHACAERRYVFPDEAAAAASPDGRSGQHIVARSEEDALQQAQQR